jgi:hypothetical protein
LADDSRDCKSLFDELPAAGADPAALFSRHDHDRSHCFAKGTDVSYGNNEPGFSGNHSLASTVAVGGDDGKTGRASFQNADRQPFPSRREDEGVGRGEKGLYVALET